MFAAGQAYLQQLQFMSHVAFGQADLVPLLRKLLRCMRYVRASVESDLRRPNGCPARTMAACDALVRDAIDVFEAHTRQTCPSAAFFDSERDMRMARDMAAVDGACVDAAQEPLLRDCIRALRALEATREFHRSLLAAQEALETYPIATYAYGSTSFATWRDLLAVPVVAAALRRIRAVPHPEACTVFGSSTGSLALYTALLADVPVRGVEILPFLVEQAQELAVGVPRVTFEACDMLTASLGHTRFLVLASQCWDGALWAKLERKLVELTSCIVLDYTDRLSRSNGFNLVGTAVGDVSWHTGHTFYIYERAIA
ncbi:hypothetical protein SPRG_00864 [Saprolegnia parasitica CBS 223.65]|uniref:Methyltransferase domain-containing protein n=1 Tax=Saprolegnia parasitica (strain CBS 223.65) TaxID=695850 RepID=A0A067CWD4_SAPPC|nr:hypothetical protein SPRG_00864 [Saprolegnia parasitica CBS 223.65]KDO34803.1 hypothetical protein SPRG_00864 [Saprolegnia parasitica CBS 223.65]|eukprot:XP_012194470.1 hypothetical protein SPRG_00864 [Saprolegnia parasitica CBS 223.65]